MAQKLAVLVSGEGTLLQAMLQSELNVHVVLADRKCRAVDIVAADAGIHPIIMEATSLMDEAERAQYTNNVARTLGDRNVGLIAMDGFMTVFSREIFGPYGGRILNSHPSLLPRFKGRYAVRAALESGEKITGCTIYVATEEPYTGSILAQQSVEIKEGDTEEALHERIKEVECELYPQIVRRFAYQLLDKPRPVFA